MRRPSRRIQRSRALPARIWSPWTGSGPPGRDSATVFGGGAALRFLTLDRKRRHVPHAAQQAGCKDRAAAARAAGGAPGGRASAGRGRSQAVGEGGHNDDIPFPGRTLNIAEHERSSFLAAPIQYPLRGFLLYSNTAVTDGVSGGTGPSASSLRASFIDFGGCGLGTGMRWWWALLLLAAQPIGEHAACFCLCQSAFQSPPARFSLLHHISSPPARHQP